MDHIAILAKKRKLLPKILSGEKTIESRWYKFKKTPYLNISKGDIVYFKDSGEPVTAKAKVKDVLFFKDLDEGKIIKILQDYGKQICIPLSYASSLKDKKYCTLVFLGRAQPVGPFSIDKTGYGNMSAWISVDNIKSIKKVL